MRTPLNAIIGYSEILIEDFGDGLPDQTINDLKTIIDLAKEIEKAIEKKNTDGIAPLGLHLLLGETADVKMRNVFDQVLMGSLAPGLIVAQAP